MLANIIIAGTEKAGTTALYTHLSQHPRICASKVKETNFFRGKLSGNGQIDMRAYLDFFPKHDSQQDVLLEASPGYLGESETTASRIAALLPHARIVFVLRDPVTRLHSLYNQHHANKNIPADLSFNDFVQACLSHERHERTAFTAQLSDWHLKTMMAGLYARKLRPFLELFARDQILVFDYDTFCIDPQRVVREICDSLLLDYRTMIGRDVAHVNATIAARSIWLHRLAYRANSTFESLLRHRPHLKRRITGLYKLVNEHRQPTAPMDESTRKLLLEYYSPANSQLKELIASSCQFAWTADGAGH